MSVRSMVEASQTPSEKDTPIELLYERGLAHHQAGQLAEAQELYWLVLSSDDRHADALYMLGMIASQRGDSEAAASNIRRAITINPHAAQFYASLGGVLQKVGFAKEAASYYLHALVIQPDLAVAHADLASVFLEAGKLGLAMTWFQRAIALDAEVSQTHRILRDALQQKVRPDGASATDHRARLLEMEDADAFHWAGKVLREVGDLAGALERFRKAQALEPNHPRAGFGEAMVQLLQGDYERGWSSYECRWESLDHQTPKRPYPQPKWRGEQLDSGKLLLWPEQGIGDEIMFAGLIPDVIRSGINCMFACDPRLRPLFARSFRGVEVVADTLPSESGGSLLPQDIQAQLPMGSLPGLYRKSPASFQTVASPYLTPDPVRRNELREHYADGRRLAGLAWYSNSAETGASRSIDLMTLAPLFSLAGIRWVSMQYGDPGALVEAVAAANAPLLIDGAINQFTDMDGFAAQVAAMDLVLTIDNTTAHLAGALGVPVWLLLPFGPDWRWLADGDRSLWYPSMRLFRQTRRGNWETVVEDVRNALIELVSCPVG